VLNVESPSLAGVSILVVDDHDDGREALEQVLTQAGATVIPAASARAALTHLDAVELIVTDYFMPGETGLWLLERVGERDRTVPVIVVTGYADDYADQLARAPFARVLRKPIDPGHLCETIAAVLRDASARSPGSSPSTHSPGRVLIVEDEEQVAALLEDAVAEFGYGVRVAPTGVEALRLVPEFRPDVVLLDLALPEMSGDTVLQRLRQSDPHLPVIMVTGNTDMDVARRMLSLGAFDYVAKPFDLSRLGRMLEAALIYRS
jgi:DNA-binding NtrC family response regulator